MSDGLDHLTNAVETDNEERRNRRLDQAYEVLARAIRDQGQENNPAAWYYLGRYYTIMQHALGADSAFRRTLALAPPCADDVAQYRAALEPEVLGAAVRQWQEGKMDSATVSFAFAASLDPRDPNVPLFVGMMYADAGQLDSAGPYVELGMRLAGDDPNHARRRQQALLAVARAYDRAGSDEPALERIGASRNHGDTLVLAAARDSTLLAKLIAEWAGKPLRPDVQQAVRRDSTALARRLEASRTALPAAVEQVRSDSAAIARAMDPAVAAYETFHQHFPNDATATLRLLRLYSLAGRSSGIARLVGDMRPAGGFTDDQLLQAGVGLFNDGHHRAAAQLLEVASRQNPYNRGALFVLARAYVTLHDAQALRSTAAKLVGIDPLNQQSLRMMAAAWDLAGSRDSAATYVARADTGIGWAVTISQFAATEGSAVANGTVVNVAGRPLAATSLVFEFLAADGAVLATETVPVPALAPRAQYPMVVRVNTGGAVGWRYRRR